MDLTSLRDELIEAAIGRGFAAAGVASLEPLHSARQHTLEAISAGRMEGMPWMTAARAHASTDLGARHAWARAVITLAWPYAPARDLRAAEAQPNEGRGRMAAYACVDDAAGERADYHDVVAVACDDLASWIRARSGDGSVRVKRFVDHGWAMDRAYAQASGIGFCGKHACLITATAGSYVLLAELLVSLALPPTAPTARNCGTCRTCMPACPTGAIVAPGVIDATRCISYLTIEHRGPIPVQLRPQMGTWIFGCDLCQEACPINARLAPPAMSGPRAGHGPVPYPDLVECLELSDDEFRQQFRSTAVWRTGRSGLARNAAIALGNAGHAGALPALQRSARDDPDAVVREAAAWAIEQLRR